MEIENFPVNEPLYEQVCKMIETQIIEGNLKIGDKLQTEKELVDIYKVSRTDIREALKVFKEKGWLETHVAKGTFIVHNVTKGIENSMNIAAHMNPDSWLSNLIDIRLTIEPENAALAAVNANQEDISRMKHAINKMEKALTSKDNKDTFLEGDFSFHMAIVEATGNNLMRVIIYPVVNLMRDFQRYHLYQVPRGSQRAQSHHRKIMDAIERHDPKAALTSMYEHIIQVRDDIQNVKVT